jgi:hypothetical protein
VIARISTELETSADRAWDAVQKVDTLRYVTRGVLGFRPARGEDQPPERIHAGDVFRLRLFFFHVLPAWRHEIAIREVDEERRELSTTERGGLVKRWNHAIRISELPPATGEELSQPGRARARYTDELDIGAGVLTAFVWAYAQLFYRYRQWRWRRLARTLT